MAEAEGAAFAAQVNAVFTTMVGKTLVNLLIERGLISFDDAAAVYRTVTIEARTIGGRLGASVATLAADETMRWETAKAAGTAN